MSEDKSLQELIQGSVPLTHAPPKDRLTYQFSVVHEHFGDTPKGLQKSGDMILQSQEESFSRRIVIGSEPKALPQGWFEGFGEVGFIIVHNLAGENLTHHPTAEVRADIDKSFIKIQYEDSPEGILLPPGFPQMLLPTNHSKLRLSSLHKDIECRIFLFPRL